MRENLIHRLKDTKSKDDFNELALRIFHYQANNCEVYKEFLNLLGRRSNQIQSVAEIPCLPIEVFKKRRVTTSEEVQMEFTSSGTGGQAFSTHYVREVSIYEWSFRKAFELNYGSLSEYVVLGLLPNYLERSGSSLVYMVNDLINHSRDVRSGFYLHNFAELHQTLLEIKSLNKKVLIIGVTYALLDLAEKYPIHYPNLVVMETGGMKGKRKELVRADLHQQLINAFGVKTIHSEYGMTELLSQAYSHGNGLFNSPPWMEIFIREVDDPFSYANDGVTGGVNVIDLANIDSCSFIATSDLGKKQGDQFEILGRFDYSDVRGCNLLIS